MTLLRNTNIKSQDSSSIDAFGRWRVSRIGERFNIEFVYNKQPLYFTEVNSGTSSAIHNSDSRDVTLSINDDNSGSTCKFQQNWSNPYTPGNSQKIDMTGNLNLSGITGGTTEVFLKNGIDSTEEVYTQSQWDDTVDDVNWNYSQIFSMDFQSLKVGRIRFYLVRNGKYVKVKEIYNDNIRENGFWQYPQQPLTWKIYNTDTETISEIGYFDDNNGIGFRHRIPVNSGASMNAICGTVKSEDGASLNQLAGNHFSANRGITTQTVSTSLIALISIRVKNTFYSLKNKNIAIPLDYSIQCNNDILFKMILNADVSNTSWQSVDNRSFVEYDISGDTISGGYVVSSEYIASGSNNREVNINSQLFSTLILSTLPDGSQNILTLAAVRTGGADSDTLAGINWKEVL